MPIDDRRTPEEHARAEKVAEETVSGWWAEGDRPQDQFAKRLLVRGVTNALLAFCPATEPPPGKPHVCTYECANTDCENVVGPAPPATPETPKRKGRCAGCDGVTEFHDHPDVPAPATAEPAQCLCSEEWQTCAACDPAEPAKEKA